MTPVALQVIAARLSDVEIAVVSRAAKAALGVETARQAREMVAKAVGP